MRISELIRLKPRGEPISLSRLQELRDLLDREGDNLSLLSSAAAGDIIEQYVTPADPAADPLYRFLKSIAGNGGRGAGFLMRGPRSSGKTHLLAAADLLLEYPRLRAMMTAAHEAYSQVLNPLSRIDPILVVPVPLEEHRAHDEHLEDIFFDRTEQELRRLRYNVSLPLSENSYALDLIERHVVPRYGSELDSHVARMPGTQRSWRDLRDRNPSAAVAAARAFAQEIGYPLDFRQSRVERLARLLDMINNRNFKAIVWLVDDLGQFLAATGQKAVRNDAAFLEFLGQRSKIAPLYVLGTMSLSLDQTSGIEPYMLTNILDNYETLSVSAAEMRRVALQRSLIIPKPDLLASTVNEVHEAYQQAFGQPGFTATDLQASYPLHPLALTCLESIYNRFLSEADGLVDFLQSLAASFGPPSPPRLSADAGRGAGGEGRPSGNLALLDRDHTHLLSLSEVLDHVAGRLSAHPQAAPYLQEALDYYDKNGPQLFPDAPDLPAQLARQLIVLRLANISVPVDRLAEALGLSTGQEENRVGQVSNLPALPRVTPQRVRECLEQMRLRGRFVDVHRGGTPESDAYTIDVEANLTEMARRQLLAFKTSLADDDSRLWEAAASAANAPSLPLADLREPHTLEVEWGNSLRTVLVQTLNLKALSADRLAGRCADLSDTATPEDVRLCLAEIIRPAEQRNAWREAAAGLPRSRWSSGVAAWIPRDLTPEELDRLKELAACRSIIQDAGPRYDPKVSDRLVEEASRLTNEVRAIIEIAYAEGEVISGEGALVSAADLTRVRGDWPSTLAVIAGAALTRVFPQFPAPRLLLSGREAVDSLLTHLLGPDGLIFETEEPIGELAEAFLEPLQMVVREGEHWHLQVDNSDLAAEIMDRVRRRDQTPETEPGRPIPMADLAAYLLKSPFGLPGGLFELAIAALIRAGYLVPLDVEREPLLLSSLKPPLTEQVAFVSRSPLLDSGAWQDLTRVCRVLLERMVPRADHSLQTELWEALCASKDERSHEIGRLRKVFEALRIRLNQAPEAWADTTAGLDALQGLFDAIDPTLLPAQGLSQFLGHVAPLLQGSPSHLAALLRQMAALDAFLQRTAPDVVTTYDYLRSTELSTTEDPDLQVRRRQLLELIASGEALINDETAFRRQVQILLSVYKRRYIAWHTRCYRMGVFDKYRALRTSPELRVLAHLQRLELKLKHEGPQAVELVEAQEARRCLAPNLNEALDETPVCPECGLKLDQEIDLVPLEDIKQAAENEIRAYVTELRRPAFQQALKEYALALPTRGDLVTKLEQLLTISENPPARVLLGLLTDDVILHLNRVLSGKTIRARDFGQLRTVLAGRTLSKEEAQTLFQRWLSGEEGDTGEEPDEVIHVEP
ncbi:MAG: hypothetical protein ACYC63_06375 [Armatimonadota bacterium]